MSDEVSSATETEAETVDESASLYDRWLAIRGKEGTVAALTILGVALAPFVLVTLPAEVGLPRNYSWYHNLVTLTLIWGIFALGYDLLLGFTGLLSFGHAIFWGTAAYAAGIFSANVTGSPLAMVLVGTLTAVVIAWVIGWISLRRGGIYFAILTLAFGQMIYYIFLSPLGEITGGENGFNNVEVGSLFGPIFGAGLYMYVANIISGAPVVGDFWHMILGLVFIGVIVLMPQGIWGRVEWVRDRVADALGGDER